MSDINSTEIITDESLINEVRNVNKMIPLEIDLSQSLTIEENFANISAFRKSKKITFYATCSYTLDFSTITNNDITIDDTSNKIYIKITKPDNFNIYIDESKTKYYEPELGFLRFSDIQLTSEDYGEIYEKLNECFSSKMKDKSLYDQCLSNAENNIENILLNLTQKSYNVTITFKDN